MENMKSKTLLFLLLTAYLLFACDNKAVKLKETIIYNIDTTKIKDQNLKKVIDLLKTERFIEGSLTNFYQKFKPYINEPHFSDEPPGHLSNIDFRIKGDHQINNNNYFQVYLDKVPSDINFDSTLEGKNWTLEKLGKYKISVITICSDTSKYELIEIKKK
jgi:hypothetical protein